MVASGPQSIGIHTIKPTAKRLTGTNGDGKGKNYHFNGKKITAVKRQSKFPMDHHLSGESRSRRRPWSK